MRSAGAPSGIEKRLLLLFLPLLAGALWRASLADSFWLDEHYSVIIAAQGPARILELTRFDGNPPGYYLLLWAWRQALQGVGIEAAILAQRLMGVLAWTLLVWLSFRLSRRALGEAAVPLTLAVGVSAQALHSASELRAYSVAAPVLLVCLLLGLRLADESGPRGRGLSWLLLPLLAAAAVFTHWLSAVAVVALGLVGAAALALSRRLATGVGVAVAAAVAVITAVPSFLDHARAQMAALGDDPHVWKTTANLANFLRSFVEWLPLGPAPVPEPLTTLGSLLGLLSPLPLVYAAVAWRKQGVLGRGTLLGLGVVGVGSSMLFIASLVVIDAVTQIPVFHGPRYASLVAGPWAAGLAALSFWAAERLAFSPGAGWLLLAPWLGASLVGQVGLHAYRPGITLLKPGIAGALPRDGRPIYVLPAALVPCYRATFSEWTLLPADRLLAAAGRSDATLLHVNPHLSLDLPMDSLVYALARSGRLSERVARFPPAPGLLEVLNLHGLREDALLALRGPDPHARAREELQGRAAYAVPELQSADRGWWRLFIEPDGRLARIAHPSAQLDFTGTPAKGERVVVLEGRVDAQRGVQLEVRVGAFTRAFDLPNGPFVIRVEHAELQGMPRVDLRYRGAPQARLLFGLGWFER